MKELSDFIDLLVNHNKIRKTKRKGVFHNFLSSKFPLKRKYYSRY